MTAAALSIPADVTFEQAIALTEDFLAQSGQWSAEAIEGFVAALTASLNGARGFFVTYLTAEHALADQQHPAVIAGLKAHPATVDDLMTRNLAMSTAMVLTHQRNHDPEMARGSQTVSRRSLEHLQALMSPALQQRLRDLQLSLWEHGSPYSDFLRRWDYDDEQRRAIAQVLEPLLSPGQTNC
jgi:hypothetical protein